MFKFDVVFIAMVLLTAAIIIGAYIVAGVRYSQNNNGQLEKEQSQSVETSTDQKHETKTSLRFGLRR